MINSKSKEVTEMKEFENYVVLITGGGSGIGQETTRQFIEGGASVVTADVRQEAIDNTLKVIGQGVSGKTCDVTNSKDIQELKKFVEEKHGKLDVLVNGAATIRWGNIEVLAEEDWDLTVNSLLKAPYLMMKYFIPLLKKSDNPSVVNISSLAAIHNWPNNPVYGAAKWALEKLSRQVTRDFHWLRCNAIQPGIIDTPMYNLFLNDEEKKALFERYASLTPAGRVGTPADIANSIIFLSSKRASFINGATLLVDGGFTQNWLPDW